MWFQGTFQLFSTNSLAISHVHQAALTTSLWDTLLHSFSCFNLVICCTSSGQVGGWLLFHLFVTAFLTTYIRIHIMILASSLQLSSGNLPRKNSSSFKITRIPQIENNLLSSLALRGASIRQLQKMCSHVPTVFPPHLQQEFSTAGYILWSLSGV